MLVCLNGIRRIRWTSLVPNKSGRAAAKFHPHGIPLCVVVPSLATPPSLISNFASKTSRLLVSPFSLPPPTTSQKQNNISILAKIKPRRLFLQLYQPNNRLPHFNRYVCIARSTPTLPLLHRSSPPVVIANATPRSPPPVRPSRPHRRRPGLASQLPPTWSLAAMPSADDRLSEQAAKAPPRAGSLLC